MATCSWSGKSGTKYIYDIYPINTKWNDIGGNYIFSKRASSSIWNPIYIGETGNLNNRLTKHHEKWNCAILNGATHIHAHVRNSNSRPKRIAEETNLLRNYNTPCND